MKTEIKTVQLFVTGRHNALAALAEAEPLRDHARRIRTSLTQALGVHGLGALHVIITP